MQLGWVDFSDEDRRKTMDLLSRIQEEAVDELGIGVVRDAFSDYFFPGTSTIQTRAKYFLLVPYMIQSALSDKKIKTSRDILENIRKKDEECGRALYENKHDLKVKGIIGSRSLATGRWVVRTPIDIYWAGICRLGICKTEFKSLNTIVRKASEQRVTGIASGHEYSRILKPFELPENKSDDWEKYLRSVDIKLTGQEAEFLRDKILKNAVIKKTGQDTLFAWLLKNNNYWNVSSENHSQDGNDLNSGDNGKESDNPFKKLKDIIKDKVPDYLKEMMELACEFNELVYAARVRYNVLLSKEKNDEACSAWGKVIGNTSQYTKVDIESVFSSLCLDSKGHRALKEFLLNFKSALNNGVESELDRVIIEREAKIKKKKAKLSGVKEYERADWVGGKYLDYRFLDAEQIILDIQEGMEGENVSN